MVPIFIHIMSTGDIWVSADSSFTPTGTILSTHRVASLAKSQKIGAVSGNSGSYAVSGGTGKNGAEIK